MVQRSCERHVQSRFSYAGFDVVCNEHKVCGSSTNASAPDGPCYCCTLDLQVCLLGMPSWTPFLWWVCARHHWLTLNNQHCTHGGDP